MGSTLFYISFVTSFIWRDHASLVNQTEPFENHFMTDFFTKVKCVIFYQIVKGNHLSDSGIRFNSK